MDLPDGPSGCIIPRSPDSVLIGGVRHLVSRGHRLQLSLDPPVSAFQIPREEMKRLWGSHRLALIGNTCRGQVALREEGKGCRQSLTVVMPHTHTPVEQYSSNCLSQACSEKRKKISTKKRRSHANSTFGNAVAVLNKNYFIAFLSSPSPSKLLRVRIQMNISDPNIYPNGDVNDSQMLAGRVGTER